MRSRGGKFWRRPRKEAKWSIMEPRELQEVAIVIRPEKDNVAVVTVDFIEKDTPLKYEGQVFTVSGRTSNTVQVVF